MLSGIRMAWHSIRKGGVRKTIRFARERALVFTLFLIASALGFQFLFGERGFLTYVVLQHEHKEVLKSYEIAMAERMAMEHRVRRMRPDAMDADLLEEQAKRMIGYAHPDEVVVMIGESK